MRIACRSVIAVVALASTMSSPAWAEEFKIATVDRAKVIKQSQAGQKGTAALQEYMNARKKIVDMEQADLVRMSEDYGKQAAVLSPEARKDREEAFNKKKAEFEKKSRELAREVQDKQQELAMIFNQQLDDVVKAIARKEQILLIMDSGMSLYQTPAIDLTDRVIKEMNKANK